MRTWAKRSIGVAIVCVVLLAASCSGSGSSSDGPEASEGATELFDASTIHSISVEFDDAAYDEMIQTFSDTGEKDWIEATVSIDGTTYERAGLRLKGNSSLMGLGGSGPGGDANGEDADAADDGDAAAEPGAPGGPRGRGGFGGGADAESPQDLPWLIRLDEFVPDQLHQGYADIVVRSNNSESSLNEAVALDLLAATPLASQLAVSTTFSVNGSDSVLRLAIEHPDDDAWQDRVFSGDGALYKSESTGDWSYRGDDPAAYDEVFDQEGGKKVADLTPLMELLQFINESTDEEFAEDLDQHLDVDAFATYLAMMELIGNTDDIDGPGNNAYLWWDADTEQFTVVPWDMNLAFGQFGGGIGGPPEGFDPEGLPEGFEPPEGFQPPEGMDLPEGFDPEAIQEGEQPEGFEPGQRPGGGGADGGAPGFGGGNVLVERFLENPEFEQLYREQLDYFRADLFGSGAADELLADRVDTLASASDVIDPDTLEAEASTLGEQIGASADGGD